MDNSFFDDIGRSIAATPYQRDAAQLRPITGAQKDQAERLDRARALSRRLADAIWQVDSAESLLRKAQPSTGYRSSEKLGDGLWNIPAIKAQVTNAHLHLGDLLLLLELGAVPVYLNGYEKRAAAGRQGN